MEPMTVGQLAAAVDGVWLNPREDVPAVTAVCTDSRKLVPGCLFLPWVGERFDGHDFIENALEEGAAGCLCAKVPPVLREDRFYIQVRDTRLAFRDLASAYRDQFALPIIQVTGSVGKTTTKEMIAAVLGAGRRVWKTPGNYNNDVGVPLTLLDLSREHQAAVVETGMDHAGEIDYLSAMVKPDIAAPGTNISTIGPNNTFVQVSGTSFATPFVTGSAALLMEWGIVRGNDGFLYGEKVKAYLRRGAKPIRGERVYPNEKVGYGALCVENSLPL